MNFVFTAAAFLIGLVAGIGLTLLYIQYSMYSQVGKMEEQMQEVMNLEEDLIDMESDPQNQKEE